MVDLPPHSLWSSYSHPIRIQGTQMTEDVRIDRSGGVLAITLARPGRRNAITVAMYAALADAIESAAEDPALRLITLRGEGEDFTAGNDLADFMAAMPRIGSEGGRKSPSGACFGRSPSTRCRSLPRSMAMRSASAPRCCCIATSCWPRGTRFSLHCRPRLVPEAASSCFCRASPDAAGRRAICYANPSAGRSDGMGTGTGPCRPTGWRALAEPSRRCSPSRHGAAPDAKAASPRVERGNPRALRAGNAHFSERLHRRGQGAITAFYEKRKPDFTGLG